MWDPVLGPVPKLGGSSAPAHRGCTDSSFLLKCSGQRGSSFISGLALHRNARCHFQPGRSCLAQAAGRPGLGHAWGLAASPLPPPAAATESDPGGSCSTEKPVTGREPEVPEQVPSVPCTQPPPEGHLGRCRAVGGSVKRTKLSQAVVPAKFSAWRAGAAPALAAPQAPCPAGWRGLAARPRPWLTAGGCAWAWRAARPCSSPAASRAAAAAVTLSGPSAAEPDPGGGGGTGRGGLWPLLRGSAVGGSLVGRTTTPMVPRGGAAPAGRRSAHVRAVAWRSHDQPVRQAPAEVRAAAAPHGQRRQEGVLVRPRPRRRRGGGGRASGRDHPAAQRHRPRGGGRRPAGGYGHREGGTGAPGEGPAPSRASLRRDAAKGGLGPRVGVMSASPSPVAFNHVRRPGAGRGRPAGSCGVPGLCSVSSSGGSSGPFRARPSPGAPGKAGPSLGRGSHGRGMGPSGHTWGKI